MKLYVSLAILGLAAVAASPIYDYEVSDCDGEGTEPDSPWDPSPVIPGPVWQPIDVPQERPYPKPEVEGGDLHVSNTPDVSGEEYPCCRPYNSPERIEAVRNGLCGGCDGGSTGCGGEVPVETTQAPTQPPIVVVKDDQGGYCDAIGEWIEWTTVKKYMDNRGKYDTEEKKLRLAKVLIFNQAKRLGIVLDDDYDYLAELPEDNPLADIELEELRVHRW